MLLGQGLRASLFPEPPPSLATLPPRACFLGPAVGLQPRARSSRPHPGTELLGGHRAGWESESQGEQEAVREEGALAGVQRGADQPGPGLCACLRGWGSDG